MSTFPPIPYNPFDYTDLPFGLEPCVCSIQTAGNLWWLDAQMAQIVLQEYQESWLIGEFLGGTRAGIS
jgi:hypothetical protein